MKEKSRSERVSDLRAKIIARHMFNLTDKMVCEADRDTAKQAATNAILLAKCVQPFNIELEEEQFEAMMADPEESEEVV